MARGKKIATILNPRAGGLRQAVSASRTETTQRGQIRSMLISLQRQARAEKVEELLKQWERA